MGKQAKTQPVRGSMDPKAGKKKRYQEPPKANAEKQDARGLGLQQFVAKVFPQPLPFEKRTWDAAMDTLCAHFGVRRVRKNTKDDTGLRWDTNRKQVVVPPNYVKEG